jgi:hypothetical protein
MRKNFSLLAALFLLVSASSAHASICVGQNVVANMSDGHFDAVIVALYSDNTALIRYTSGAPSGETQTVDVSNLSDIITSEGGFSVSNQVVANMSDGHFDAIISELYDDSTALIRYTSGTPAGESQVVALSNLSQPISSTSGFNVGDGVVANMSDGHFQAIIRELYSDNTVSIQYTSGAPAGETQVVDLTSITHPIYQSGGFHVNETVVANMADGHFDAIIREIYSDQTASIQYTSGAPAGETQVVALSYLSQPIRCEGGCH